MQFWSKQRVPLPRVTPISSCEKPRLPNPPNPLEKCKGYFAGCKPHSCVQFASPLLFITPIFQTDALLSQEYLIQCSPSPSHFTLLSSLRSNFHNVLLSYKYFTSHCFFYEGDLVIYSAILPAITQTTCSSSTLGLFPSLGSNIQNI